MPSDSLPPSPYWFSEPADLFAVVTPDGIVRALSASSVRLLGHAPQTIVGRPWKEFVHPEDLAATEAWLREVAGRRAERRGFVNRYRTKHDDLVWLEWTAQAIDGVLFVAGRDLTRQRQADERAARSEALWRSVFEQAPIAMVLADPDGRLVEVNPAMCALLGTVADELVGRGFDALVAGEDVEAARENFAELLSGEADRYEVERRYLRPDGGIVWGHAAVTATVTPDGERRVLAQVLDITARKREEAQLGEELADLASLSRLRDAMDAGRLIVYAQPIVCLRTGAVVREELLVRLRDEHGAIVGPDRFLPAAERFGLIGEVDHWVVGRAIELARAGRAVSVNVSTRSIGNDLLVDTVEDAVREGVDPGRITFEMTETALADDMDVVLEFARRVTGLGCGFAIDDFGVGYGGLLYLKKLGGLSATIKIDRGFVRQVVRDAEDQRIVHATIGLATSFGQSVVAEGIEDEATAAYLAEAGAAFGQGYHFGRPAPAA